MTYYIGAGGSDSNDGKTWATRWLTYAHAGTVMLAGDLLATQAPETPQNYITSADIEGAMPDSNADWTQYAAFIADAAEQASRDIDAFCHMPDGFFLAQTSATYRYYNGSGDVFQEIDPCVEIDEVGVDETGSGDYVIWVADQDYKTFPYNLDSTHPISGLEIDLINLNKEGWYRFQKSVRVKARWGWSATVPSWVAKAAKVQACRWLKRAQQAFQDAGAIVELHQLQYVNKLDPDVQALLESKGFGGPSF